MAAPINPIKIANNQGFAWLGLIAVRSVLTSSDMKVLTYLFTVT